jgi:hypothetical protein
VRSPVALASGEGGWAFASGAGAVSCDGPASSGGVFPQGVVLAGSKPTEPLFTKLMWIWSQWFWVKLPRSSIGLTPEEIR